MKDGELSTLSSSASKKKRSATKEKRSSKKRSREENGSPMLDSAKGDAEKSSKKKRRSMKKADESPVAVPNSSEMDQEPPSSDKRSPKKKKRSSNSSPSTANGIACSEQKSTADQQHSTDGVPSGKAGRVAKKKKSSGQQMKYAPVKPLISHVEAPEPKAEDAYLHGPLSLLLAPSSVVKSMALNEQHDYLRKVTSQCEKLIDSIHNCLQVFEKKNDGMNVEQQLTADMVRLKKIPLAKQYAEMTLWRRTKLFSRARLETARKLAYGKGESKLGEDNGLLLHQTGDPDPKFVSYRQAYLNGVIDRYKDSFENMRKNESLDARQTEYLAHCLGMTADLFSNIKCIEDKKRQEKR